MAVINVVSRKKYITRMNGISFSVTIIMKNITKSTTRKKKTEKRNTILEKKRRLTKVPSRKVPHRTQQKKSGRKQDSRSVRRRGSPVRVRRKSQKARVMPPVISVPTLYAELMVSMSVERLAAKTGDMADSCAQRRMTWWMT